MKAVLFTIGTLMSMVFVANAFSIAQQPYSAVGSCPTVDGETPVYLPDSVNCSTFYECSAGVPVEKECMPGLCFDTTLNVCGFPKTMEEDLNIAPYDPVGSCPPRDTNVTVFLPDSANCTVYYVCSNGNPIQNVCPPDMAFNPTSNICDWEIDANCNSGSVLDFSFYSPVGSCPPRDTNVTIFLPDSENCTVYYLCSNGNAIQNVCPPDMSFNPESNICDWEIDVQCESGSRSFIQTRTAVGTCPEKDPGTPVYLPDSERCDIYYECSGGVPIENDCPPDLEFNPVLHICDFPLDSGCKGTSGNSTTRPTTAAPDTPTTSLY